MNGKKLWKCPKCKRQFSKKNQSHSCKIYPLEKHFKGKEKIAKPIYNKLKKEIKKQIGSFTIDSPECCIHFVKKSTFAAVYALKDKIRIHFILDKKINSSRIRRFSQMSANRYLYSLDILKEKEIDKELLNWIKQAYNLN